MNQKLGVMLCGHGSRDADAIAEFAQLAIQLAKRLPQYPVEYGYLEFARPILHEGLDRLRANGVGHVLAVPGMLFAAGHVKNDIPIVLNRYSAKHPAFRIDFGRDLGIDPKLIRAAGERIEVTIRTGDAAITAHETLLVVVGRGTSDPDANANVSKVTRLLWEGFGFGWAETAYSGVTFPLVEPALEHAARLPYRRIIVFPYFLFTGILVQRIYDAADAVAARHPHLEILKAPYLNDHPLVIDTFLERIGQVLEGDTHMNCSLCKYRTQLLGFEDEVGLPQASHHDHVEGIAANNSSREGQIHDHDHGHSHGHEHYHGDVLDYGYGHRNDGVSEAGLNKPSKAGHAHRHDYDRGAHHPYPHADHPLGPSIKSKARIP